MGKLLKNPLVLVLLGWTIKSVMDGKSPIPGFPMFGLSGGNMGAFTNASIPGTNARVRNVGLHPY